MEPIKKTRLKNKDMNDRMEHIYKNAVGNPVVFKAVPTNKTMKANTWGIFEDDIYIKAANGNAVKISGAQLGD